MQGRLRRFFVQALGLARRSHWYTNELSGLIPPAARAQNRRVI
jgi:hypothetical protein